MLRANFHTHTTLCDGSSTPEEMAARAAGLGFTALGFSGHMDPDIHMDMNAYVRRITALREQYCGRMDILTGIELDTLYDPAYADRAEYTVGSTHFPDVSCNRGYTHVSGKNSGTDGLPQADLLFRREGCKAAGLPEPDASSGLGIRRTAGTPQKSGKGSAAETGSGEPGDRPVSVDASPEDLRFLAETFFGGDFYRLARNYFETEAQVYDRLHCTFVGHFDLIVKFNDQMHFLDETDPRYTGPALEAMEYLVREGVPFEINTGAVSRGIRKDFYPGTFLLKSLHDMGGEIVISSDAHKAELLDGAFDRAVSQAVRCGFTHTNVLGHGPDGKVFWHQTALDTVLSL